MIHYTRWDMVTELRERRDELLKNLGDDSGMTWEKCYAAVSKMLENTEADTGRKSVAQERERVIPAGKPLRHDP